MLRTPEDMMTKDEEEAMAQRLAANTGKRRSECALNRVTLLLVYRGYGGVE